MKTILILAILLTSFNGLAATKLSKGDIAPFSGILITKAEEAKVAKLKKENEILEKLKFKQSKLIENQGKRIGILHEKLEERDVSGLVKTLYFIGGVLLTGTSVYLAGKLAR